MKHNKILALKYRPQEFKDLIGQDILSKTITNAIKVGKTPNAYLLTGIRGVGKTTTARLIAKALNCEKNKKKICNSESPCDSCKDITNSIHIDVLEMDAASKTGIDDIRELIENSKYSPTRADYKIFIIDEVHMLSKQAFNGLLKTLEEPPPRLKFILATTEVKKIPVTILSRCQRFDLKRVEIEKIISLLNEISKKEKGKISHDALRIIAQAAEGSVRDAISLLDRAISFQDVNEKDQVSGDDVRKMLGLADKSKIIKLINAVFLGDANQSLKILNELFNDGVEAKYFLNDILQVLSLINRKISLGSIENDKILPEQEINSINEISKNITINDIGLYWQFTIKTIDDLRILNDDETTLEMYVLQLLHLKKIVKQPHENLEKAQTIQEEKKKIFNDENIPKDSDKLKIKNQLKNIDQVKTNAIEHPKLKDERKPSLQIDNFETIVQLANKENEIGLKFDLERNVKLVSFKQGKIDISFNEKLNKNFIKALTEKLYEWTGDRWIISLNKKIGDKTIYEKKNENKKNIINEAKNNQNIKRFLDTFKDANLIDVESEDNS